MKETFFWDCQASVITFSMFLNVIFVGSKYLGLSEIWMFWCLSDECEISEFLLIIVFWVFIHVYSVLVIPLLFEVNSLSCMAFNYDIFVNNVCDFDIFTYINVVIF
ncbi:hypothetical protein F2P56_013811, partial [Juglans regia]